MRGCPSHHFGKSRPKDSLSEAIRLRYAGLLRSVLVEALGWANSRAPKSRGAFQGSSAAGSWITRIGLAVVAVINLGAVALSVDLPCGSPGPVLGGVLVEGGSFPRVFGVLARNGSECGTLVYTWIVDANDVLVEAGERRAPPESSFGDRRDALARLARSNRYVATAIDWYAGLADGAGMVPGLSGNLDYVCPNCYGAQSSDYANTYNTGLAVSLVQAGRGLARHGARFLARRLFRVGAAKGGGGRNFVQDLLSIKRQKGLGDIAAGTRAEAETIGRAWVNGKNVKRFDLKGGGFGLTDGTRSFRLQYKPKMGFGRRISRKTPSSQGVRGV